MISKNFLLLFSLLLSLSSFAQIDTTNQSQSRLINRNGVSNEFIREVYLQNSLDHLFTNYYDFSYYQINTTSDFSQPDPYIFSLTGGSFKWNRFYFDGHRINDLYFPGYTLYKPFLYSNELAIDIIDSKIEFTPALNSIDQLTVNWSSGKFGDKVPWYNWYVNNIQGHNSAFQGSFKPIELRKHLNNSGTFYFHKNISTGEKEIPLTGYLNFGSRDQISFDYQGIDKLYSEKFKEIFLNSKLPLKQGAIFDNIQFLFGYKQRDNQFSEFYFDDSESAKQNQVSLSSWGMRKKNGRKLSLGFNTSFGRIDHVDENFARNVVDQDGEGMEPWYPSANVFQFNLVHSQTIPLLAKNFSIEIETNNGLVSQNPLKSSATNAVYYQDNLIPFTPLFVTQWNSSKFSSAILENEADLVYTKHFFNDKIFFRGQLGFSFDGFLLSSKSFVNLAAQVRASLEWKPNTHNNIGLNFGRRRVPFHFDYVRFISDDYYSGQSFFWNDSNGDQVYQSAETGGLYSTTGGQYHFLGSNLKQPSIYYMDLSWDVNLGRNWFFTIDNQFRSFRNLWSVEYLQDTSSIGYFQDVNGRQIFYLNGGQQIDYQVVNLKPETMELGAEKKLGWAFNQPFYGGSTMKLSKEGKKFFLSISFSAYMVVGFGPTGNGPLQNNIDILSEGVANPNTYINFIGRLDQDRAFVVRTLVGWKFGKSFTASFMVKFKDGQPVSLFESNIESQGSENQVAIWNTINKGISPYTGQFGFREGAFWNYELKMKYSLQQKNIPLEVVFNIYNIMDIATLLNNYSFSPYAPNRRSGMEVQIPRGFLLGLNYYF